jgi:hypothetical protein
MSRRCLAASLVAIAALSGAPVGADMPVPKVTKVPADKPGSPGRNYPFFSTDIVLANYGYVEEEFFYEGTANTYSAPEAGRNAEITKSGIPFRSRLLVRRPAAQKHFNGIVFVEWFNVTNGYDTDVLWLYQKEFLIREGYAWVGVSAQDGGVSRAPNGIKVWSPKRYGSLDLTAGGTVTDASLNFDIYSQAGVAVRNVPAVLGGMKFTHLIAAGQSQSAGRLGPYLNGVHHREPVFDAALLTVNNTPLRTDLTIPVIKVLSETERFSSRREPDSTKVRVWTVAGSTHSEQYSLLSRAAFLKRDLNLEAVDACDTPARSRVEIRYVYNAATDWLVRWLRTGAAPPRGPQLQFDETAAPLAPAPGGRGQAGPAEKPVKRDAHGNILGGIRLAELEAPVALESAELCGLGGTHVPFDAATLNRLYPTHASFVARVTAASRAAVNAGFLLAEDAAQSIAAAKRSIYGLQLTCGPLCSDERQFPSHPSSMLLSKQTSHLMIKDGETLVKIMDNVTKLLAEGYTQDNTLAGRRKFAAAASEIHAFIAQTKKLRARGHMPEETEALLVRQAGVLAERLAARGQRP